MQVTRRSQTPAVPPAQCTFSIRTGLLASTVTPGSASLTVPTIVLWAEAPMGASASRRPIPSPHLTAPCVNSSSIRLCWAQFVEGRPVPVNLNLWTRLPSIVSPT